MPRFTLTERRTHRLIPTPAPVVTERHLNVSLHDYANSGGNCIHYDAKKAHITKRGHATAYRIIGIEYRDGPHGPYPSLRLAVIAISEPDECPVGWCWVKEDIYG